MISRPAFDVSPSPSGCLSALLSLLDSSSLCPLISLSYQPCVRILIHLILAAQRRHLPDRRAADITPCPDFSITESQVILPHIQCARDAVMSVLTAYGLQIFRCCEEARLHASGPDEILRHVSKGAYLYRLPIPSTYLRSGPKMPVRLALLPAHAQKQEVSKHV